MIILIYYYTDEFCCFKCADGDADAADLDLDVEQNSTN